MKKFVLVWLLFLVLFGLKTPTWAAGTDWRKTTGFLQAYKKGAVIKGFVVTEKEIWLVADQSGEVSKCSIPKWISLYFEEESGQQWLVVKVGGKGLSLEQINKTKLRFLVKFSKSE